MFSANIVSSQRLTTLIAATSSPPAEGNYVNWDPIVLRLIIGRWSLISALFSKTKQSLRDKRKLFNPRPRYWQISTIVIQLNFLIVLVNWPITKYPYQPPRMEDSVWCNPNLISHEIQTWSWVGFVLLFLYDKYYDYDNTHSSLCADPFSQRARGTKSSRPSSGL